MASCEDALVEAPKSLAVETFYNTTSEVEAALNAIYTPLRADNCMGGLYPAQQEAQTDYGYGRGSYTIISDFGGLNSANITRVGQMWDLFYQAIRNANLVIKNAPNGKQIAAADITKFVAEARFLRAFIYFTMVRNWGGVPLRTENNMTDMDLARSSVEEVYSLIMEDLIFAENNLPDVYKPAGHPTKWTAKTVLADVYLNIKRWNEARDKADEVIKSGKHSLVNVLTSDDFQKISGPDVTNTPEEIFYLKYNAQNGFNLVMFAHHPGSKLHGAGGYYAHYSDTVKNSVIKNWSKADLRKAYNLYSWNIGLGTASVLFKKFIDLKAPNGSGASNDYPIYRYSELLLIYAEAANNANGGPTVDAVEKLNMVHRRAYGYVPNQPSAVDFVLGDYNLQSFNDLVLKERGYETMYEGKRWLDLKRTGKAKEIILAVQGKTVADKHLLWPVPTSETNYNKAIDPVKDQNPGY